MKTKNIISIVQKDNDVDLMVINNSKFANEFVQVNNESGVWGNYKVNDIAVVGKLKDKGENVVSIIKVEGDIVTVYLNETQKAEANYSMLVKESGKGFDTYKLIHKLETI